MSLPPAGTRMIRVEDGMRGVVVQLADGNRIMFEDRGDNIVASKLERWEPERQEPHRSMRAEEIRQVALAADRQLRSIEKNEPLRFWEPVRGDTTPHDPKLVAVVEIYLHSRQ